MFRRPWPILMLALLQFLTPVIYLAFAAGFYNVSIGSATREIMELTPFTRQLEIFILPLILGLLIFMTNRIAYLIAMIGCIYGIVAGVLAFVLSNQTDPVFPIILSNLFCLAAIGYLARSKARNIYFNQRLRWWETELRYVVNFPSSVTRVGGAPMKATLLNIASGGAGVETLNSGFLKGEVITLEFQNAGTVHHLKAKVMWEKPIDSAKQFIGIHWEDENTKPERSKVRRLIRSLKTAKTPTTRHAPPLLAHLKNHFN